MHHFWAMDDADKVWLIIQYGTVSLFVLSVGLAVAMMLYLAIGVIKDHIQQKMRRRQMDVYMPNQPAYSPQDDPQVALFQLKQIRRKRRDERDEFFDIVQELQNDLR